MNEAGNKVFIGRATYKGQLAEGKLITTASPGIKAGLTLESHQSEHFLTEGVEYYAIEDSCNYEWVPSTKGQIVEHAIQYQNAGYTMYVGRVNASNSVQVGKVPVPYGLHYTHKGQYFNDLESFDVLTCKYIAVPSSDIEELRAEKQILIIAIVTLKKSLETKISNLKVKLSQCEAAVTSCHDLSE